ncbi:MAG: nitroreductase family protein [Pelovirga sp.]
MLDLLRARRSVRKFTAQPVAAEHLDLLREALLRAPTSRNLQPCHFVLVDDRDLLEQLATAKPHGTSFFSSAPLAVVIAADPTLSDVWIEDCSVAATIVQLVAEDLGLKSCWGQLRRRQHDESLSAGDYVRALVGLPEGLEVPMVIAIGYPAESKSGHPYASLLHDRVAHNRP